MLIIYKLSHIIIIIKLLITKQHEKRIIEDRLKKWSDERLCKEGFALLQLCIFNRGNLYQDKVVRIMSNKARFDKKGNYNLPFHRFSVGNDNMII